MVNADVDDIAWWCAEHATAVIVGGTEFAVARPGGEAAQSRFYSGRRKTHTHKTIAVCDAASNLLWATPLVRGATHNLPVLRTGALRRLAHPATERSPRSSGFFNSVLASNQMRIEHAMRRLKQWRCLTTRNSVETRSGACYRSAGHSPCSNRHGVDNETPRTSSTWLIAHRASKEAAEVEFYGEPRLLLAN